MQTFQVTLKSMQPIDLGDLNAEGFENLLGAVGIVQPFTWQQDGSGRITVTFWHEAADSERALGASERRCSELGVGAWDVSVEEGEGPAATASPITPENPG
jgi:hypothetical protein